MKKYYSILFIIIMLFSSQAFSQCNGFAFGQAACASGCTGTATAYGFGGTPPYTYSWNSGQSTSGATALCVGSYTVTISDNAGCTVSKTASVTAKAPPSITAVSVDATCSTCPDGYAYVTPTGTGPFTYIWTPSGGNSDTAKTLTPGTYTVSVTDIITSCDSCTSVTVGFTSGVFERSFINNNLKIFPNPVTDVAIIQFNSPINEQVILSVVNILGEEVYSEKLQSTNQTTVNLDMKGMTPGVYFVNIKCKDFTARQKVIKE